MPHIMDSLSLCSFMVVMSPLLRYRPFSLVSSRFDYANSVFVHRSILLVFTEHSMHLLDMVCYDII